MARAGNYEEALNNARRVKEMIEGQVRTEEQKALFGIFMREYEEITAALDSAMAEERGADARSAFARTENRSDHVAHKLYSHKVAKSEGCLVQ